MDNGNSNGHGPGHNEEFRLASDQVMTKFKELVSEGNIRKISIRTDEGRTLFEIPLTYGVAGAAATLLFAPALAAIGAIAALVTHVTIVVERTDSQQ